MEEIEPKLNQLFNKHEAELKAQFENIVRHNDESHLQEEIKGLKQKVEELETIIHDKDIIIESLNENNLSLKISLENAKENEEKEPLTPSISDIDGSDQPHVDLTRDDIDDVLNKPQ